MNVLPNFQIHSRINKHMLYNGIDSMDNCDDKNWFKHYPHRVLYDFNFRGFRDSEWPTTIEELQDAIWCFGDSFTVGLGSPIDHTWCKVLEHKTQRRTINISMDGASNQWMCRWVQQVHEQINPDNMVIMWSYLHRREDSNVLLTDEARRIWNTRSTVEEDLEDFKQCVLALKPVKGVQHFVIPEANQYEHWLNIWKQVSGKSWPEQPLTVKDFLNLPEFVIKEMKEFGVYKKIYLATKANEQFKLFCKEQQIHSVEVLDLARDNVHFGQLTSMCIVNQMSRRIV